MTATVSLSLRLESWPALDAVDELKAAHEALTHRHGDVFRRLERDIEDVVESGRVVDGDLARLGPDCFAVLPSTSITNLLRRARTLGVLEP